MTDPKELAHRMRNLRSGTRWDRETASQAADALDALAAERDRLREALWGLVESVEFYGATDLLLAAGFDVSADALTDDISNARAALNEGGGDE